MRGDNASDSSHQEEAMPAPFRPSIAAVGVGAAVALAAAVPMIGAAAATHRTPASHHRSERAEHVAMRGLIAAHHGRNVAVFAKRVSVGATTAHNTRVTVTFARHVHTAAHHTVGNRIRLSAIGRMSGNRITVLRHNDEVVQPAPASLAFGVIDAINGNVLTLSMRNHDDGDHGSGRDQRDGDDNDARPADHSPGGPGDGGNSGPGHSVAVDTTNATITVDRSTGTALAVGDTAAVLGEYDNGEIVAADVFGFTNAPDFIRGTVTAIDGDNVTVGDDDHHRGHGGGDDHATPAHHGGGDDGNDETVTASLANVPLALNGSLGAKASDLTAGDKLILIGTNHAGSGGFTPEVGFAFNGDDHHPCGHNGDNGDDHGHDGGHGHDRHHGHDGGIDG